ALRRARDELEIRVEERTRELHHVSHRLGQILNSASEGILGLGQDGRITFANPTAAAILDLPVEHLVGVEAHRLAGRLRIAQGTSGRRLPVRAALMRGAVAARAELTLERPQAAPLSLEFAGAPVEENGILVGMVAIFRDITERKRSEEKLRLAATVFGTTAEAILVLGPDRAVQAANPAFAQITGHCAEEVMGRAPTFLDGEEGMTAIWEAVETDGRWQGERWNHRKNGERYAERFAITTVIDDQGLVAQYVVVFSDITQRKLDEERIRYQANYDALTGLPNRALFQDRLHTMVSAAQRTGDMLGLMFIDLDGFKLVNDTLGHDMGDELLKEAARRLSECVRSGDTVARLGGDEFTVLMPHLQDFRNAPIAAQRIIDTLEQPFDLGGKEAFVSASIGIATFPNDATDSQTLLKHADAAMYRAKEQGKANFQFYTADMNAEVTERLVIKNGLSKALEREEFTLYYQPKIDLRQNRMVGVEALLRWRNAELGPVSPAKFIPVMEETGLITPVGEWAIETACRQHREWTEAGLPIRIAVNLSVRQLRQGGLAKTVSDLLSRAGIPPSGLELEITESMIMKDTENAVATLRELDEMGIHLAMDDFGTGYSSLSYLKRFPLHTIKIDRSFISDIATDQDDLEIIRTIISMGHSL
ncbi:MAG: EAL domain-containing protein, partial [Rhodospirillales bacterium]|nr:EAL domain-containing protein [Rhodospirillales bacterium]